MLENNVNENSAKNKCVYCKKSIKKFTKTKDNPDRKVHRKCWLKNRKFDDRCFDYFFTERDNKTKKLIKSEYQSILPTGNQNLLLTSCPLPSQSPPQIE